MKRSDISDTEVIEACRRFHADPFVHDLRPDIALAGKYPIKVIMAKMAQLARKDLLEYGVSLRTAWPTDYRKAASD